MELEIGRESEAKSIQKTDWTISSLLGRSAPLAPLLLPYFYYYICHVFGQNALVLDAEALKRRENERFLDKIYAHKAYV